MYFFSCEIYSIMEHHSSIDNLHAINWFFILKYQKRDRERGILRQWLNTVFRFVRTAARVWMQDVLQRSRTFHSIIHHRNAYGTRNTQKYIVCFLLTLGLSWSPKSLFWLVMCVLVMSFRVLWCLIERSVYKRRRVCILHIAMCVQIFTRSEFEGDKVERMRSFYIPTAEL